MSLTSSTSTSSTSSRPSVSSDSTNTRVLMSAYVLSQYGPSCVHQRFGTTSLGQEYCLFTRKRFLGGYQTHMVTANHRNSPFISVCFKVSGYQVLEESKSFIERLSRILSSSTIFSLGDQPQGVQIPIGKDMIQMDLVDEGVHNNPDKYLKKGDELYVEVNLTGSVCFYHSGVYAGNWKVYHFMSLSQQEMTPLNSVVQTFARSPGSVLLDPWNEFIHAMIDVSEKPPRLFRVSHALMVRSGEEIVKEAENLHKTWQEYDIRRRNCQHFSSTCVTGASFSLDMSSLPKYIACTLMLPTVALASNHNKDDSR